MNKPSPQDCREYALSLGYSMDGQKFYDWYELNGWTDDWKAAVRSWHRQSKTSEEDRYQEVPKEPENERQERCLRRGICYLCYGMITNRFDDQRYRCEACLKDYTDKVVK